MERFKPYLRWAAVIAGVIALAFAYFAPHRSESVVVADDSPPPPQAIASADAATSALAASPSPGEIAVYVCGAIRHVGVFRLAPGSRIVDAVARAGGLAGDADPEAINLAEPLVDGMKIDVPKKGARPATYSDAGDATYDVASTGANVTGSSSHRSTHHRSSGRSGVSKLQPGQTVDVNTASEGELERLPGVGPSLARRIIEYREANGPFATPDDLQNVSGIGPSKFAKMEAFVRV